MICTTRRQQKYQIWTTNAKQVKSGTCFSFNYSTGICPKRKCLKVLALHWWSAFLVLDLGLDLRLWDAVLVLDLWRWGLWNAFFVPDLGLDGCLLWALHWWSAFFVLDLDGCQNPLVCPNTCSARTTAPFCVKLLQGLA